MVEYLIFPLKKSIILEYVQSAELIKFLLIPFVCFWIYGFPDGIGLVELLSGFAVPAFFVLSGYFTLAGDEKERGERLKRTIIRDAIFFGILFFIYIAINLLVPLFRNDLSISMLLNKRLWFSFLVLNFWPLNVGESIWFIQSLLYANIILYFANKLHLLRFYKMFLVILVIVMLLSGELAGVIGFSFLGYAYIPGGFLTRALPYLLLGMLLQEKYDSLKKIPFWVYLIIFVLGGGLVVGEYYLLFKIGKLVYISHMFGYMVMSIAVCGLMIAWDNMPINPISYYGGRCAKIVYAIHNPLFFFIYLMVIINNPDHVDSFLLFAGCIVYVASLIISIIISLIIPVRVDREITPEDLIEDDL